MGLVDSHCHLQHAAFNGDREEVLQRSLEVLDWLIIIGDDTQSSREAAALCRPRVYAAVGIHPHNAAKAGPADFEQIRQLLNAPGVVALGEVGLDYHYEFSPRSVQREVFRRQLDAAIEAGVPTVIHCREAEDDLLADIEPCAGSIKTVVMHCFGGNADFADACVALGFYVSFAGNVTFPKATTLRDAAVRVPHDRLLVETDSPYLSPQPVRGKRCEPLYVEYTARCLADLLGMPFDEFASMTTHNAARAFSGVSPQG